jgi:hypothetical protein
MVNHKEKTMKPFKFFSLVAAIALVMGINAYAATLEIDPFDASQGPLTAPPDASGTADDAGILGGERDVQVHYTGGPLNVEVNVNPGGNSLYTHSQDASTTGASWIIWDGNDGDATTLDPTGLGGVDLTFGQPLNIVGILVGIADNDLSNADALRIEVYTDAGNWSFIETGIPVGASIFFPKFNTYSVGAGTGADFTNVGAIALHINGTTEPAQDLSLDLIAASTVPEPSTIILLGIGVAGLVIGLRRRKHA